MFKDIKSFRKNFCILISLIVCVVLCGFLASSVNNTANPMSITLTDTVHDGTKTKLAYEDIQKNGAPALSPNAKGRTEAIIKTLQSVKDTEIVTYSDDKKVFVNLSLVDKTRLTGSEENTIKEIVSLQYRTAATDVVIQYT